MLTHTEVLNTLWNLYDEAVIAEAFESFEDHVNMRELLANFGPQHTDLVVEYRDDALGEADIPSAAEWAVELSHVIEAMNTPGFWPTVQSIDPDHVAHLHDQMVADNEVALSKE